MPARVIAVALLGAGFWNAAATLSADVPPNATVLDPDIVWDIANPHSFAISHDGKRIAYISKGAVWVCPVGAGPPAKLADLPNTVTAILAERENLKQREQSSSAPHSIGYRPFYGPVHVNMHYVFSLAWTPSDDGVVFAVMKRIRENSPVRSYHVMHASLMGVVTEIAVIEGEFGVPQEYTTSFHVTPDQRFVVASAYAPLIWDVQTAHPVATSYDLLLPSSASGRFLGIEIDTRQLVLVDEQFQITKRLDVVFPAERTVDLTWSDDERFAVCRTRENYQSNGATALRIDLETGQQSALGKCNIRDQFVFTGDDGGVLHLRVASVIVWGYFDGELGTRATIVGSNGARRSVITTQQIRKPDKGQRGTVFPPIIAAPDGKNVAVAVPRPEGQAPGAHYHLVTLDGDVKPFVPVNDASYITPYYPIAFAEGGDLLIARSGSTLFSLPVPLVAENPEAGDEK